MKIIDFKSGSYEPFEIALGHFDGVHLGHRKILKNGLAESKLLNCTFAVTSFEDCPNKCENIYPFNKRVEIFSSLGVERVIKLNYSKIKHMPGKNFFDRLINSFNVKKIICGRDYTFGCDMLGTDELFELCKMNKIEFELIDYVFIDNQKVSSTLIKKELANNLLKANELLGAPFEISGKVVKGNRVGNKIGFPTANIDMNAEYAKLKIGVYGTITNIDGKDYFSITNYGPRPTFGSNKNLVETHILGNDTFELYDKIINIRFVKYLREIISFVSIFELKEQLNKDGEWLND